MLVLPHHLPGSLFGEGSQRLAALIVSGGTVLVAVPESQSTEELRFLDLAHRPLRGCVLRRIDWHGRADHRLRRRLVRRTTYQPPCSGWTRLIAMASYGATAPAERHLRWEVVIVVEP
ncbi:hypothetical protein ABT288_13410 [Streptomyces sp. NPDC001093]|uniref:hypothetical protein n=1 Tax=Streptomyces sp. NPDC001093 TaxID=3154376 RepID=UPI003331A5F7